MTEQNDVPAVEADSSAAAASNSPVAAAGNPIADAPQVGAAKPAGAERRAAKRKSLRTQVVLSLKGSMVMTKAFDISESGIGLVADHNLAAGQQCTIAFNLLQTGGPSFQAQTAAIIAYNTFSAQRGGFALGLQFKSPPPALIEAIRRYIA